MTPLEARAQNAKRQQQRRQAEGLCALDFLTWEDTRGEHAKRCIKPAGLVCSREYNPGPPPEDEDLYEGSPLLALWASKNTTPAGAVDLLSAIRAGWTITRRKDIA